MPPWVSPPIIRITHQQWHLSQRCGILMVITSLCFCVFQSHFNLISFPMWVGSTSLRFVCYFQFTPMERFAFQSFMHQVMIRMVMSLQVNAGIQFIRYVFEVSRHISAFVIMDIRCSLLLLYALFVYAFMLCILLAFGDVKV